MNQNRRSDIQELIRWAEGYIAERRAKGLPVAKAEARLAELKALQAGPQATSPLPDPAFAAGEIERLMALGQHLKTQEIKAIRCGLTGKRCTQCQGVPCWGSQPWDED